APEAMTAMNNSLTGFLNAANTGEFAVNETGGQALISAMRNMRDWIDQNQYQFAQLKREPQLGSTNNANVLKPFMVAVATDDQGFVTQIMKLRESLVHAEEAIKAAMANYQDTDAQVAATLRTDD
uniref:hypothetical protein n=1 Tax=Actinokineospora enzanensis TaxID=155975 RepID=UPI00316AE1B0